MQGPQGPTGPQGPDGARGGQGNPGEDGLIFVPIYYREPGVGQAVDLVSLTEQEDHTHVSYYRSDNPLRSLIFGGPNNTYDPDNPSLDSNAHQAKHTQHLSLIHI